jgi:phage terminase Nu1 subunit (DNA packaging protein)
MVKKKVKAKPSKIKETPPPEPQNPNILKTQREVAAYFCVTVRSINHWIQEGMPATPDGHYDLESIKKWKAAREEARKKSPENELSQYDSRFRKAKAELAEMELSKRRGELISRDEVHTGWVMRVETIKKALLSLPKTLAPQVAGLDVKEATSIIDRRIREIIENFAKS